MTQKKISGYQAILYSAAKGTLSPGTGAAALADDSWFMINAIAASGSVLPIGKETAIFQSPKNAADAITPIVGDDVYPMTLTRLAKVDVSMSTSKGVIDITDDLDDGYVSSITDGFSDISGSINGFLRFESTGGLTTLTKDIMSRFFDVVEDDGEGGYTLTAKNDDDLYLMILLNSKDTTTGNIQTYLIVPVILTGTANNQPLKGGQNMDLSYQKAQGWAGLYERTVVAAA